MNGISFVELIQMKFLKKRNVSLNQNLEEYGWLLELFKLLYYQLFLLFSLYLLREENISEYNKKRKIEK